jgi:hypothetical protein
MMSNPSMRETENGTKEEYVEATVAPMIEGKPLVFL